MSQFVDLKAKDVILPGFLKFSVSNAAYRILSNHPLGASEMLRKLTTNKVLLITKGKEDKYEVFTREGSYVFRLSKDKITDKDNLLLTSFNENTLIKQNNAMKNGVCFHVEQGIIVQITLKEYQMFYDICNGGIEQNNRFKSDNDINASVEDAIHIIKNKLNTLTSESEDEEVEEEYQPEKGLVNLLQIAEHYAILSSQLAEEKAHTLGRIAYHAVSALEYDRLDRIAYQFSIDAESIDESIFKTGVQVELLDMNSKKVAAEVISIDSETEGELKLNLLFSGQFDRKDIPSIGWISLAFSSVNKDIQLEAIEKIRTGEAPSKYMDIVLGKKSSAGFMNKDLKNVNEELAKLEHRPNDSQISGINSGVCSKDVFLVMGPPGTGKTTVILEWVKYFVKEEHKRVLVSSQNNKAVDNVLARIADEKDIDIIRIGSEAKLQSEVIPFTFENKIKKLNEHIMDHTQENIKETQQLYQAWYQLSQGIELITRLNTEVDNFTDELKKWILFDTAPLYEKLIQVFHQFNELEENITKLEADIAKDINKIEHYEQLTGFKKFIVKVPSMIRKNELTSRVKKYDELKKTELSTCTEYNNLMADYNVGKADIMLNRVFPLCEKMDGRDKTVVTVNNMVPTVKNRWNLFTGIDLEPEEWIDNFRLGIDHKFIKEDIQRTKDLIEAISVWRNEIGGVQNYALKDIVLESVDLVGATCIGINSQRKFNNLDFDITIIDEAGQIQIHNALVPMSVSNKLIMLGDHKQIPPTADAELLKLCINNGVDTTLLEKSLFEKMYEELPQYNKTMLDTQYRMPSEIADIISDWFYSGEYKSADFKKGLKSQMPNLFHSPFVIIDTAKEYKRFETKIPNAGSHNVLEAEIIDSLIRYLTFTMETDLKEVGIISAYKSQVKLIKEKLCQFIPSKEVSELVATLDSYQGQERNIIIYSFTKSSYIKEDKKRIGFLNELRRLNVAMTRCKKMLILVGDMQFLSNCENINEGEDSYNKSEKEFSDFIKKMLEAVEKGKGELISYKEFENRMESAEKSVG